MISRLYSSEKARFLALVLLASILLTVLLTFPHVLEWRSAVPGPEHGDAYNYAWSSWWFDKALFDLHQSPADMDHIYYPTGAYHPKEIAAIWAKVVTVPGIHLLGIDPFALYNFNLFAATVLTLFFMTWLCWELTGSRAAGLIGAIIFSFAAGRINQLLLGHLTQSMTYFYPMLVLAMVRLWRDPGLIRGLLFGLILGLAALVDLVPLAFFVAPVTLTLLLFQFLSDRRRFVSRPFLGSLLPGLLLAVVIVLPFFYPMLASANQGELEWYKGVGAVQFSADALAFVIPPPGHVLAQVWPALGAYSEQILSFGLSEFEGTAYLGWIAILLAFIALLKSWANRPAVRYWFTVTFASVVFALGPWLRAGGRIINLRGQPLLMPYVALMYLPFMGWGRTPGRLGLTAVFAVAILAAFGAAWSLGRIQRKNLRLVLAVLLFGLILIDSMSLFPWSMHEHEVPAFYEQMAADPRHVAVLDLPVQGYVPPKYYMLYQMTHGHAIVGGWRDRRSPEVEAEMAEFSSFAGPGGDVDALAEAGIGYIVLHQKFLDSAQLQLMKSHLDQAIGEALFDGDGITVYRLDNAAEVAPRPVSGR